MSYSAFLQHVLSFFQNHFGASAEISVHKVIKNNQVELDALTILESGSNVSPTLYLNYYYEKLREGTPLEHILNQLLSAYQSTRPLEKIDVSFFTKFENISGRIFHKLINARENAAQLTTIPHIPFLDLAIVFYCLICAGTKGNATILIRSQHLSLWEITPELLARHAARNTQSQLPPTLFDMNTLLQESALDCKHEMSSSSSPFYILTNPRKIYGAASILDGGFLKNFALTHRSDFYILPSSVHEVLLLPADGQPEPSELNKMVREVNQTQLTREEILSDHIYFYSLSDESLHIMS